MIEESKYDRWYRLDSELIDAHVLLPPEKRKKVKKSADSHDFDFLMVGRPDLHMEKRQIFGNVLQLASHLLASCQL